MSENEQQFNKKQTLWTDSVSVSAKFLILGYKIAYFGIPDSGLSTGSVFHRVGFFTKLSTKINQTPKNIREFNDFNDLGANLYNSLMIVW